jgi:hypothetical protein
VSYVSSSEFKRLFVNPLRTGVDIVALRLTIPSVDDFIAKVHNYVTLGKPKVLPGVPPLTQNFLNNVNDCIEFLEREIIDEFLAPSTGGDTIRLYVVVDCDGEGVLSSVIQLHSRVIEEEHGPSVLKCYPLGYLASPINLVERVATQSGFCLAWEAPDMEVAPKFSYQLKYNAVGSQDGAFVDVSAGSLSSQVFGLIRDTSYVVSLRPVLRLRISSDRNKEIVMKGQAASLEVKTLAQSTDRRIKVRDFITFNTYSVDITTDCTASMLKDLLSPSCGYPAAQQRLFYSGAEIGDEALMMMKTDTFLTLYRCCGMLWLKKLTVVTPATLTDNGVHEDAYTSITDEGISCVAEVSFEIEFDTDPRNGILLRDIVCAAVTDRRDVSKPLVALRNADSMILHDCKIDYDVVRHKVTVQPHEVLPRGTYFLCPELRGCANGIVDWIVVTVVGVNSV